MSRRAPASAGAAAWAVAGEGLGAGSGPVTVSAPASAASARSATAAAPGSIFVIASSFSPPLTDVRLLPRPHLAARVVEQPLVVALAQLLAGLGRELREQRCVHVVDLQVLRLLGGSHLVGAEHAPVRVAVDEVGRGR